MLPARIPVGIRKVTIPNPALLFQREIGSRVFSGLATDYDFEKQTDNYLKLRRVLQDNNMDFAEVAAAHYKGYEHTNHRFVVTTNSGRLLWHKYVGMAAQSGQNHVFVGGMRIKVSIFLVLTALEQDALLSGDTAQIERVITPKRARWMNEDKTLWC